MRNFEYLTVLTEAVRAVRTSMADHRLPELTPEQIAWWFRTVSVSDIERVMQANAEPHLEIVWRREPNNRPDSGTQVDAYTGPRDWSAAT